MVIRNQLAESMEYHRQWKEKKRQHEREKDYTDGNELISGMKKGERFLPVITLVAYFGEKKWDAALCLHDLLDFGAYKQELSKYITNYRIHVFDYHDKEDFSMFHTELQKVYNFLRCAGDKEQLKKLIAEHKEDYYNVDTETCEFIATVTNSKKLLEHKNRTREGGIDMCKALDDLWKEGVETGMAQGISQGISQGRQQGIEEKTRIIVTNLLKRGMADADICALAECSIEFLEKVKKINGNDTM